jgi:hypothetical protein
MKESEKINADILSNYQGAMKQLDAAKEAHEKQIGEHNKLIKFHNTKMFDFNELMKENIKLSAVHTNDQARLAAMQTFVTRLENSISSFEGEKRTLSESLLLSHKSEYAKLNAIILKQQHEIAEYKGTLETLHGEIEYLGEHLTKSNNMNEQLRLKLVEAVRHAELQAHTVHQQTPPQTNAGSAQDQYKLQLAQYEEKKTRFYHEQYAIQMETQKKFIKKSQDQQHNDAIQAARLDVYNIFNRILTLPSPPQQPQRAVLPQEPRVMQTRQPSLPPPNIEDKDVYNARRGAFFAKAYKIKYEQLLRDNVPGDQAEIIAKAYGDDYVQIYFYPDDPRPEDISQLGMQNAKAKFLQNAQSVHSKSPYFRDFPFPPAKTGCKFGKYPISREQSLEFYEKTLNKSRNKFKRLGFGDDFVEKQARFEADNFHRAEFGHSPSQSVIASTTKHFKINRKL